MKAIANVKVSIKTPWDYESLLDYLSAEGYAEIDYSTMHRKEISRRSDCSIVGINREEKTVHQIARATVLNARKFGATLYSSGRHYESAIKAIMFLDGRLVKNLSGNRKGSRPPRGIVDKSGTEYLSAKDFLLKTDNPISSVAAVRRSIRLKIPYKGHLLRYKEVA